MFMILKYLITDSQVAREKKNIYYKRNKESYFYLKRWGIKCILKKYQSSKTKTSYRNVLDKGG